MKLRLFLLISLAALFLLPACVSSKKYKLSQSQLESSNLLAGTRAKNIEQLESQVAALRTDTTRLGMQLRKCLSDKAVLERTSSSTQQQLAAELQEKQREIDEKERLLAQKQSLLTDQTQKIDDLNAQINKQRASIDNLLKSIEAALVNFNAEELTIENRDGKIYVSMAEKLLFKSGSAAVDPKGVGALEQLADVLLKQPDISIMIEGHTDNIPIKTARFDDNWDLSVIRATAVSRILLKRGVPSDRITAAGKGESFPIAANSTPEGRSKNRRTEIILSPKLDLLFELLRGSD